MDDSLRLLSENKELPSDILLVLLIRIQLIKERIRHAPWNEASSDADTSVRAAPFFYLKALKEQMEDLKRENPTEFQDKCKLNLGHPLNGIITCSRHPAVGYLQCRTHDP
jgi:hypothetical protein